MGFLKFLSLFLFFHRVVHARNNIQVVPHYPSTAYITERLLPFSIVGEKADEKIRVQSIDLIKGQSCHTMIDPFYEKIFHVYCLKPAGVRVDITSVNANQETFKTSLDEFYVRGKNEPASFTHSNGDL